MSLTKSKTVRGKKKKSSAHDTALFGEVNILQSCEADDVNDRIM